MNNNKLFDGYPLIHVLVQTSTYCLLRLLLSIHFLVSSDFQQQLQPKISKLLVDFISESFMILGRVFRKKDIVFFSRSLKLVVNSMSCALAHHQLPEAATSRLRRQEEYVGRQVGMAEKMLMLSFLMCKVGRGPTANGKQ